MPKRCIAGYSYDNKSQECVPKKFITLRKKASKIGLKSMHQNINGIEYYTLYGYDPRRYYETKKLENYEKALKQFEQWKKGSCKKLKSQLRTFPKDSRGRDIIEWELQDRCK